MPLENLLGCIEETIAKVEICTFSVAILATIAGDALTNL